MIVEVRLRTRVVPNAYRDSVELMRVAAELEAAAGIERAGVVMGTPANLGVLREAGLLDASAAAAGPNDLIVAVAAVDDVAADEAISRAAALLTGSGADAGRRQGGAPGFVPTTIGEAVAELPGADIALVSTPGTYAAAEALKAIKHGLHVFLFSDNVSLDEEIELKTLAIERDLLMMGPDCGTAILDGIPLGFANAVHRGRIGLIGASGTGLQQVSCLIDRAGAGISQAIGVGGRDLSERVGGMMMLSAMTRLEADPGTVVIVLISKPPSEAVSSRILAAVRGMQTPVVVNFLGADDADVRDGGATPAATFEAAALAAVAISDGSTPGPVPAVDPGLMRAAHEAADGSRPGQTAVRGLFSGGSLAGEAKLILKRAHVEHTIIDLGDDEYTVGRPHPMIDPRLRSERIITLPDDPAAAVLLLDIVLGTASHPDPAGALAPAIVEA
ncbi:MAG TPA: hypothetical protein VIF44_00105, partial [Candidatus Limnocylindrales bacterium]